MHPKIFDEFTREQRQMKSFKPHDKTGVPILGMSPKSITLSGLPGFNDALVMPLRVSDKAPVRHLILEYTPLFMNPVSGKYE